MANCIGCGFNGVYPRQDIMVLLENLARKAEARKSHEFPVDSF